LNFALKSFWFVFATTILAILGNLDLKNKNRTEMRKEQTRGLFKENVLNQKLDDSIKSNLDPKKYTALEEFCMQSGFNMTVTDYYIIRIFSTLTIGFLVLITSKNLFLGILFFFIGFILPKELLETIRAKRIEKLNQQVGPFLDMIVKRYEVSGDMKTALEKTYEEFEGEEPMYAELKKTLVDVEVGVPVVDALSDLSIRTGNKYLNRFADYYEMSHKAGTQETKEELLRQAYLQFIESNDINRTLRKELSKTVMELKLTTFMIPVFLIYMVVEFEGYIEMVKTTTLGKVVFTVAIGVFMLSNWMIKKKVLAPLD